MEIIRKKQNNNRKKWIINLKQSIVDADKRVFIKKIVTKK